MTPASPETQNPTPEEGSVSRDFIRTRIAEDVARGEHEGQVVTRFPPEPNGYLHIGHAKAICINFTIAEEFGGRCNLRFDDTNPEKEDTEYVDAIQEDIRWLGFDWGPEVYYASDHFQKLYGYAIELVKKGAAYVDSQTAEETRKNRGTVTKPGTESPYRDRNVEENLELLESMKRGEFEDGTHVLRAKIDMASNNMNMRDPTLYRIRRVEHHRTGNEWCIYPLYDWAHGQSDSLEGVTHSLCSLEFENHRPLYDWFIEQLGIFHPQQIEFARLNMTYTLTAKRKLMELVEGGRVTGWDDPRMPTVIGLRRRGYTPASIRSFCAEIGVAKFNSTVDMVKLENAIREDLNKTAERRLVVLRPLKLVITNYPEGQDEELEAVNNPEDPSAGKRKVPFSRELWIEREDFMADAPRKFFRLAPGREVRLRYAYYVTCTGFTADETTGEVTEIRCTYDPETRGGDSADGRKVKGTIHWVSAQHAIEAPVRLYDHLFAKADPMEVEEGGTFLENLNPNSLVELKGARLEPGLRQAEPGQRFQFERNGYFCVDTKDSLDGSPVFNRTVSLRDSWAKIQKSQGGSKGQKSQESKKGQRRSSRGGLSLE